MRNCITVGKGLGWHNLMDMKEFKIYHILNTAIDDETLTQKDLVYNAIEAFRCRYPTYSLGFQEYQEYNVPTDPFQNNYEELATIENSTKVTHTGIDLDFDIYTMSEERKISDDKFLNIVRDVMVELIKTIQMPNFDDPEYKGMFYEGFFRTYVAILVKPELVPSKYKQSTADTECFKESFRIRIPGIKISKAHKMYFINKLLKNGNFIKRFRDYNMLNPETFLDAGSGAHPVFLLGSKKEKAKSAHIFHLLLEVDYIDDDVAVEKSDKFNGDEYKEEVPGPRGGKTGTFNTYKKHRYNLVNELSICYESRNNQLIKKREFHPKPEIETEIKVFAEQRSGRHETKFLDELDKKCLDLVSFDYKAAYIYKILGILSDKRVENYKDWLKIILILARENANYKDLAIWFSSRAPDSFAKNGLHQVNTLWDKFADMNTFKTISNGDSLYMTECEKLTVKSLYSWAKSDNPIKFAEISRKNINSRLLSIIAREGGILNETDVANILADVLENLYISCEDDTGHLVWYMFTFPQQNKKSIYDDLYKWKYDGRSPTSLVEYISEEFKIHIVDVKEIMRIKLNESQNEGEKKKLHVTITELEKTLKSIGKMKFIHSVIERSAHKFKNYYFLKHLDKDPEFMGVKNGVLDLRNRNVKLIKNYHDILISRSTGTRCEPGHIKFEPNKGDYIFNGPSESARKLFYVVKELFCGDMESFIFIMCFLASSLDHRNKRPIFFIWLGGGANGKSFILEMHINALGHVTENGYANKLNIAFFVKESKNGGPDSEKMSLEHARFTYTSESEPGDVLKMSRIKEFTSETISGNEKFKKQKMFKVNSNFCFCTNFDAVITGRDYGTWRRILAYRFLLKFVDNPDPSNKYERKVNETYMDEWTRDPVMLQAWLELLCMFYVYFHQTFDGKIANAPHNNILKETYEYQSKQDNLLRFINEKVVKVGPVHIPIGGTEPVDTQEINITTLYQAYTEWFKIKVNPNVSSIIPTELFKDLQSIPQLKKYFIKNGDFLTEHILLKIKESKSDIPKIPEVKQEKSKENEQLQEKNMELTEIKSEIKENMELTKINPELKIEIKESKMEAEF